MFNETVHRLLNELHFHYDPMIPIIMINSPLTILSLTTTLFLTHYFWFIVKKPRLVCRNVQFRKFLLTRLPILSERYWPTLWCYETHLMTYLANWLREWQAPHTSYIREYIPTPDGGQISLDWHWVPKKNELDQMNNCDDNDKRPIALFLPGLTGSSNSEYIRPMVKIAAKIGYRPVVLNHRGIANTPLLTPRLYCAASDADLRTCLDHLRRKYPNVKLMATGVSLGGIILTRYLITSGSDSKVDAAFLISVCFDFLTTNVNMERLVNYPLNNYLTRLMISIVNANSRLFEKVPNIDLNQVRKSRCLREFDEAFTRRMFNFESVEHFYKECSYKNRLQHIKTFTLFINSADDMFAPEPTLPCDIIEQHSDHVAMVVTSYGGHIGFMEGLWPTTINDYNNDADGTPSYYLERLAKQYFRAFYDCGDSIDFELSTPNANYAK